MTACPRCEAPEDQVEPRDASKVARCRACGLVFDPERAAQRRLLAPATAGAAVPEARTEQLYAPEGFDALETRVGTSASYREAGSTRSAEFVITRRWAETVPFLAGPGRFFWLLFVFMGLVATFAKDKHGGGPHPEFGALLFVLALLSFAGVTLGRRNSTEIVVKDGRLRVTHGPFPWVGNRDLLARSITQLYCEYEPPTRNSPEYYRVWAQLRGGKRLVLLDDLLSPSHALFVESAIERVLGIEDRPVEGELPK